MTPGDLQHDDRRDRTTAFLDGYPAPALLLAADGRVLACNVKGDGLKALVEQGGLPAVAQCAAQAVADQGVAQQTATYQKGVTDFTVDLTAVPLDDATVLVMARDLSMEKNLRSALVESRQRYKDLVEVSSDFAWEVGPDGTFVFVSPRGALEHTAEALVGLRPEELVLNPEQYDPLPFLTDRPMEDVELWMRRADGKVATVVMSALPLFDANDKHCGNRGVCRDVSEDRANEEALLRARNREQLLSYIVGAVRDELNPADMLTVAAKATGRALGTQGCKIYRFDGDGTLHLAASYGATTELGTPFIERVKICERSTDTVEDTIDEQSVIAVATRYRQSVNGLLSLFKPLGEAWTDDERILIADVANQLGIAAEQVANHERIVKLSRTDGMTGLLNRRAFFEEELPRRIARLERSGEVAALFYVDMDNFKQVNDVHGHQVGDDAIRALRDLLETHSRPGDAISRLGGDEFAVWMDGMTRATAETRANDLVADCAEQLARFSGSADKPLGVSVGIAMFDPSCGECLDDLIARADAAMYAVKKAGKGGVHVAERADGGIDG